MATQLEEELYHAVRYCLNRVNMDPEFAYHMLDTEAFYRLCMAESAFTGKPLDEVKLNRERNLQPEHSKREPRCSQDRERCLELETTVERLKEDNARLSRGLEPRR